MNGTAFRLNKILLAGFIAGSLDILSAFIDVWISYHSPPERVLRFIASGLFGQDAYTGGSEMIIYGLVIHYLIAYSFTFLFWFVYPGLKGLLKYPLLIAIVYGIFVWAVMNLVVLPITQVKRGPFQILRALKAASILIIAIGLPLTFMIRKYIFKETKTPA